MLDSLQYEAARACAESLGFSSEVWTGRLHSAGYTSVDHAALSAARTDLLALEPALLNSFIELLAGAAGCVPLNYQTRQNSYCALLTTHWRRLLDAEAEPTPIDSLALGVALHGLSLDPGMYSSLFHGALVRQVLPTADCYTALIKRLLVDLGIASAAYHYAAHHAAPSHRRSAVIHSERAFPALNVFLVEDNAVDRTVLQGLLHILGHRVQLAEAASSVLAALQSRRFDLIILDVQTGGGRALEFAAYSYVNCPQALGALPPLIATAAEMDSAVRARCDQAGIAVVLSKPVRLLDLLGALQKAAGWGVVADVPQRVAEEPVLTQVDIDEALDRMDHDTGLFAEVAEVFLQQLPEQLGALEQARGMRDQVALARAAHRLRGSFGNFYATSAVRAAELIESLAGTNQLSGVDTAIGTLRREATSLRTALLGFLKSQQGAGDRSQN